MWFWLKQGFGSLMEAIGISWRDPSQVTDGDKLNFMMAVVIGAIGIGLGFLGYRITKRQAEIAEEQHKFFEREAQRKAVLQVALPNPPSQTGKNPDRYQLYIHNTGGKAGAGFWYLGIPKRMRGRVTVEPSNARRVNNLRNQTESARPPSPAQIRAAPSVFFPRLRLVRRCRSAAEVIDTSIWPFIALTARTSVCSPMLRAFPASSLAITGCLTPSFAAS